MLKLLVTFCFFQLTFGVIVKINDGVLRGSILRNMDGKPFVSFQGVPFAKPPVGNLRFRDPQPVERWRGIRDATKEPPVCVQKVFVQKDAYIGDEDCLYLNVYTPTFYSFRRLPVLVFIHGGAFTEGSGARSYYGPEFMLSEDIILVTVNYRLDIFGFTAFDNPALGVPGNAALKDQNMALKWVKKNIARFGGDPNKITVSGESTGGGSVHLHVLSPLSRGLFKRAVIQSGSALAPWCTGRQNNGVTSARILGYEGDDESTMLDILQNASLDQLKEAAKNSTYARPIHYQNTFGPVVERSPEGAFLPDTAMNIIKSGNLDRDVELMTGVTTSEGIFFDVVFILREGVFNPLPEENFIPYDFNLNEEDKAAVADTLRTFYDTQPSNPNNRIKLTSDSYFVFPTYQTIFAHMAYGQTIYVYLMDSESEMNIYKNSNPVTINFDGMSHIDDLWYLYTQVDTPNSAFVAGSVEYRAIKNSVSLLANFVKTGKPTRPGDAVQWEPISNDSINYFNINLDQNSVGVEFYKDRIKFWCDLRKEYNVEMFCPENW